MMPPGSQQTHRRQHEQEKPNAEPSLGCRCYRCPRSPKCIHRPLPDRRPGCFLAVHCHGVEARIYFSWCNP